MNTRTFCMILLLSSCSPLAPEVDLTSKQWISGSENCDENTDPAIQVVMYNESTWILRQNKCSNYEAPFMYLFMGSEKALLMDTGATTDEENFPLYKEVRKIIDLWEKEHETIDLIVAHTHKHGDHYAADAQFTGKPNTTVLGLEVEDVKQHFQISNWPQEIAEVDLGNRIMKVIPIPGHEASSIAVYDASTKILLTGDSFYPGRLYVNDWKAFKSSIDRLLEFTNSNEISNILGNHIEMTQQAGVDYAMGTTYQPEESPLPLSVNDLKELSNALNQLGDKPKQEVHDRFIIFPVN